MMVLRWLAPLAGFLILALALAPLRLVLPLLDPAAAGFSARNVTGTIWRGGISGATWRGVALGDMRVGVRAHDLFAGAGGFSFRATGPVTSGAVFASGDALRFDRLAARIPLDELTPALPPGAAAFITNAALIPSAAGCEDASGDIAVEGLPAPGPSRLEGVIACRNGAMFAALQDSTGASQATFSIDLADPAAPVVTAIAADPTTRLLLEQLGVRLDPELDAP